MKIKLGNSLWDIKVWEGEIKEKSLLSIDIVMMDSLSKIRLTPKFVDPLVQASEEKLRVNLIRKQNKKRKVISINLEQRQEKIRRIILGSMVVKRSPLSEEQVPSGPKSIQAETL